MQHIKLATQCLFCWRYNYVLYPFRSHCKQQHTDRQRTRTRQMVWRTCSSNRVGYINEVILCQARLVLGMGDHLWTGKPSPYVASHLGQLSLLPSVWQ